MFAEPPPSRITPHLWLLGSIEYPIYLAIDGSEAAIFEGGVGWTASQVLAQMGQAGIARDSVRQLIVTHAHPDHVMGIPGLRKAIPGLRVAASEKAAAALQSEKAVAFFAQMDAALASTLAARGLLSEEDRPAALEEKQIAVDRVVKEGDTIAVGSLVLQVLETPGHSDCSLSFFEPGERVLIVSDATGFYFPQDRAWWPCYFSDYGAYLQSIERLAKLDAEVLCLSHNAVLMGKDEVAAYFRGAIAATRQYHARIVAETGGGKPVRELAEVLGREIHEKTPIMPLEFFQKNCGLLAKKSLQHEETKRA